MKDILPQNVLSTMTENELHTHLESYRSLITASGIGAWEYFTELGYLNCNKMYFSMLGRDIDDYQAEGRVSIQKAWVDILHPEDRERAVKTFKDFINIVSEETYESFFRLQHINGSWVWIWSRGKFVNDIDGGRGIKIIGTHIDVTQQKNAEEEIRRERALLRTLIDNLPDTIYVKDVEARKVIANVADVDAIGVACEAEVIGKTDLELFENEIGLRGYQDDKMVLTSGEPILNKEESFIHKDGGERWLLTSKIPVRDDKGDIIKLLGIGHNITQRKKHDEAINKLNKELHSQSQELKQQAADLKLLNAQLTAQKEQELEKALAQGKFEIASEVLHDIGNALVGFGSYLNRITRLLDQRQGDPAKSLAAFIKGSSAMLAGAIGEDKAKAMESISQGIVTAQQTHRDEVTASTRELFHIVSHIQEILNIQRQFVRGQESQHERKQVNLVNLLEDCKAMMLATLTKNGIELKFAIEPGQYIIKGDHTKLMQVILNLLKNCIEATLEDSDNKTITITLGIRNNSIELKMIDSGSGFTAETGRHLFERGFTTKQSGTGLGLYNCRSIIESHKGTFEISSEGKGLGTTVCILIPVKN